ncbi:MAG TPA: hypothetical protein VNE86_06610 [Nitrososphaerales archaeon]|nr:hypothetical protein [Nitrososphaerales archaeon]
MSAQIYIGRKRQFKVGKLEVQIKKGILQGFLLLDRDYCIHNYRACFYLRFLKNPLRYLSRDSILLLPSIVGVLMLGVFSINTYIGLKDVVISQLQPSHEAANALLAIIDFLAATILIIYGNKKPFWTTLAGIVWPATFLLFILADIESKLCLFTNVNCFATVGDSYRYLIQGQAAEGWKLWQYTMETALAFLFVVIGLSLSYDLLVRRSSNVPRSN